MVNVRFSAGRTYTSAIKTGLQQINLTSTLTLNEQQIIYNFVIYVIPVTHLMFVYCRIVCTTVRHLQERYLE
jgi:hypothetical protein